MMIRYAAKVFKKAYTLQAQQSSGPLLLIFPAKNLVLHLIITDV
jgi:hypothetical protein